jgi:hypothetical protein
MVLLGILGNLGSGKTLTLAYFAWRNLYYKHMRIFSNFDLKMPHVRIRNAGDILAMKDGFAAMDELWTWADARVSSSHKNKFLTMVLAKSRKRGINIAYTSQLMRQIDVRIRGVTDFLVFPRMIMNNQVCHVDIFSNPPTRPIKVFRFNAPIIWSLYDTSEEVEDLEFD